MNNVNLIPIYIIICLSFILASCSYSAPKEMPDDFSITYYFSGGMSPTYTDIQLKIGECKYESKMNFDYAPLIYTFQLKKEDLKPLYNELRTIHAFTLKSKKIMTYDRGGESIGYTINKKIYRVADSGMSYIINRHQKVFSKSLLLITSFADRYRP